MSAINVLAHESIQTPSVAWTGLLPIIILAAAGILLLTICSLFPEKVTNKFASVYTQLAAVAAQAAHFLCGIKYKINPKVLTQLLQVRLV